jgi:hypothetical protein
MLDQIVDAPNRSGKSPEYHREATNIPLYLANKVPISFKFTIAVVYYVHVLDI